MIFDDETVINVGEDPLIEHRYYQPHDVFRHLHFMYWFADWTFLDLETICLVVDLGATFC